MPADLGPAGHAGSLTLQINVPCGLHHPVASRLQPACTRITPQGAKPVPFLAAVGIGLALRFLVPIPAGITVQAWTLLSIFVSTIAGGRAQRAHGRGRAPAGPLPAWLLSLPAHDGRKPLWCLSRGSISLLCPLKRALVPSSCWIDQEHARAVARFLLCRLPVAAGPRLGPPPAGAHPRSALAKRVCKPPPCPPTTRPTQPTSLPSLPPLAGLVLEPLPVGAWAFMAVTTAIATKTLTFAQASRPAAAAAPCSCFFVPSNDL